MFVSNFIFLINQSILNYITKIAGNKDLVQSLLFDAIVTKDFDNLKFVPRRKEHHR